MWQLKISLHAVNMFTCCKIMSHFILKKIIFLQIDIKFLREHWLHSVQLFITSNFKFCFFLAMWLPKPNSDFLSLFISSQQIDSV